MARAVLDLDAALESWSADLEEDDEDANAVRPLLRGLVARLGDAAEEGGRDRRRRDELVEDIAALRHRLRRDGAFPVADDLRRVLAGNGVDVRDSPHGSSWRHRSPIVGPA